GYPPERLAFMLEDAGVEVLVTDSSAQGGRSRKLVMLPSGGERAHTRAEGASHPTETPTHAGGPENLAYVIYTSGSTGRPKGVAITHHSAVAMLQWAREVFSAEELAGVLAATSICFDLSVFEIFAPLAWGGRVILARDALELPSLRGAAEVRLINTVPSAMTELVRLEAVPASVRTVNLAGEVLKGALVERLYRRPTIRRVFNLYGPSEDTTYSTWARIEKRAGEPTIGRPVSGTRAYVLDRSRRPVAIGVVGELFLGGAGLARGYLDRPQPTAESFVPDPFGQQKAGAGARLYRTGDLCRLRPDGAIEFLGRIDHQVKVRGFRIELGEIEAILVRNPRVRECAVLARERRPGDLHLTAFLVAEAGSREEELRVFLKEKLPEHMIPSTFELLDALPLTPSGKVDRRSLARRALPEAREPAADMADPADPSEGLLAGIWAEVLGIRRVGVHDNFFELGGHSLLATQVVSRIREAFRVEVPVQRLFEAPTVAELAGAVRRLRREDEGAAPPPPVPVARDRELPLSFAQQRLWFLDQLDPGSSAYNLPLAVRLGGAVEAALLERIFNEVVRRHEVLRTTFAAEAGEPRQVIAE
ncbi:MAG: amino acid adenylation domain-containing protein, partial [bacterium]|nr:amino acid adenylation domain-containing protein [bacterium]